MTQKNTPWRGASAPLQRAVNLTSVNSALRSGGLASDTCIASKLMRISNIGFEIRVFADMINESLPGAIKSHSMSAAGSCEQQHRIRSASPPDGKAHAE